MIFNLLKEKLDVLNFMLLKGHPTKLRKNQFYDLLGNSNNILAKMNAYSKPLSSISIMQRGFEVGRDRVSKEQGKYKISYW